MDTDDLVTSARKRAAELMDNLRETQGWRDGATMLALVSELRALQAALAAAEQRADTLAAAIDDVCALVRSSDGDWIAAASFDGLAGEIQAVVAALSSRPVQPESEQR